MGSTRSSREQPGHRGFTLAAFRALTATDLALVVESLSGPELRRLFRAAGLRIDPGRVRGRAHELLWSRVRTMPARAAIETAAVIGAHVGMSLLNDIDLPDPDPSDPLSDIRPLVPTLVATWSPRLAHLVLAALRDGGGLDGSGHAELEALVAPVGDGPARPHAATTSSTHRDPGPDPSCGEPEVGRVQGASAEVADLAGRSGTTSAGLPSPVIDRGSIAARALTLAGGGPLEHLLLEAIDRIAGESGPGCSTVDVPEMLDQLRSWAPTAPATWLLWGLAGERGLIRPRLAPKHLAQPLSDHVLAGSLIAQAVLAQPDHVATTVGAAADATRRIIASEVGQALAAPTLGALLETDPRLSTDLFGAVDTPCDGWLDLLDAVRDRSRQLLASGDLVEAEVLLRAGDEALTRWAAYVGQDPDAAHRLHAAAAGLALRRAQCRRARSDFAGAERLLDDIAEDLVAPGDRGTVVLERAMCQAGLSALSAVRLPQSPEARARLRDQLDRARAHLDACLEVDPANPGALLFRGLLAACEDDDSRAAHHLAAVEAQVDALGLSEPVLHALRAERAVAQLRLLEPGTDETGYELLAAALAGGTTPDPARLVAASEALDAHGSPRAVDVAVMATRRAPKDDAAALWLAGLADRGRPDAVAAARAAAAVDGRRTSLRVDLLLGALTGAGRARDAEESDAIVSDLEGLLARACDQALDTRWAEQLAADENLRQLLEPAHADAVRIQVLRRIGQVDEARALVKALFHRAAAGTIPGFDPLDLLDLLAELGDRPERLAVLRPLVEGPSGSATGQPPEASEPLVSRPGALILFVGGDESHAHHDSAIDASLAARGDGTTVEWFHTGWGPGWAPEAERIEARFEDADAVVLMTLMRTMLGRRLRRRAGEAGLPWLACTGQGRSSIERSIERAAEIGRQVRAARG